MNQLISTDASRIKLIYISWRSTTENPKHSSSSLLSGSVWADDWFLHCSSHLSKPSCQEWIQNYIRAQASLCSEADKLDGSDLLPGAASMLNEQPLGAREQESYLSGVLRGAERWHLCLTPVRELRNVENQHLCLYFQRALAPSKKKDKSSWCRGHQLKCRFTWEAKRAMSHPVEKRLGETWMIPAV